MLSILKSDQNGKNLADCQQTLTDAVGCNCAESHRVGITEFQLVYLQLNI